METRHDILKRRWALLRRFAGARSPSMVKAMELYARLLGRFSPTRVDGDFPALRFLEFFREEPAAAKTPGRRDHLRVVHETYKKYLISVRLNPTAREFMEIASGGEQKPAGRMTRIIRRVEAAPMPASAAEREPGETADTVYVREPDRPVAEAASNVLSRPQSKREARAPDLVVAQSHTEAGESEGRVLSRAGEESRGANANSKAMSGADGTGKTASDPRDEQARRIISKHERHLSRIVKRSLEELEAPSIIRRFAARTMSEAGRGRETTVAMNAPRDARPGETSLSASPSTTASSPVRGQEPAGRELLFASRAEAKATDGPEHGASRPEAKAAPMPGRFSRPAPLVHAKGSRGEIAREIVKAVQAARPAPRAASPSPFSSAMGADKGKAFVEQALKETLRNLPRADLELITNRVYRGIERRIMVDADRRGFRE